MTETVDVPPPEIDIKARVADAMARLENAQRELDLAMADLTVSIRADKRMVTERLKNAMAALVAARRALAAILEAVPG